jgi:hypothetical protein
MSWIIDPNFGSTLYTSEPFSPFPTGGGNKVLSFGSGAVYNTSTTAVNMVVECDLVVKNQITVVGYIHDPMAFLIGRRQSSDGSFYAVGYTQTDIGLGSRRGQMNIFKYNGTSDTFTHLTESLILSSDINTPTILQLLKLRLSINDSSIAGYLLNSSGLVLMQASTTDSQFTSAGTAGIGGHLVVGFGNNVSVPNIFADNWRAVTN